MKPPETSLEFRDVEKARTLFGPGNEHLRILERHLGVRIHTSLPVAEIALTSFSSNPSDFVKDRHLPVLLL